MSQDGTLTEQSQPNEMNVEMTDTQTPAPQESPFDTLLADLKRNGHQPEKWRELLSLAERIGENDTIQRAYESLLEQYPNTVRLSSDAGGPL